MAEDASFLSTIYLTFQTLFGWGSRIRSKLFAFSPTVNAGWHSFCLACTTTMSARSSHDGSPYRLYLGIGIDSSTPFLVPNISDLISSCLKTGLRLGDKEGESKPLSQQRKQMSLIDLCNLGEERAPERRLSKEQFYSLSKQVLVLDSSFLTSDSNLKKSPRKKNWTTTTGKQKRLYTTRPRILAPVTELATRFISLRHLS